MSRRPKLVQEETPDSRAMFTAFEPKPGATYWQFRLADAIVGDEPVFRYAPPKKGCPFTPERLACAAAGELNEGTGQITMTEFTDGVPTFSAIFASNGRQVFCIWSSNPARVEPVNLRRIRERMAQAIQERRAN